MYLYLSLILLAFTLSLDSCSVGLTYGFKRKNSTKINYNYRNVFSGCYACFNGNWTYDRENIFTCYRNAYRWACSYWNRDLGIISIFRSEKKEESKQEEKVWKLEIASLGLVIQILRKPTVADFDKSGTISAGEALLLGIALSVDSFGAGIGASLLGYAPAMMAILVAVMSSLFYLLE